MNWILCEAGGVLVSEGGFLLAREMGLAMDYIVILERVSVNPTVVQYVLRADVPVARQTYFADATKTSAYKNASAQDLASLRAGEWLEIVDRIDITGASGAVIKALLVGKQQQFQAEVTADGAYNPWKYYGSVWNGTAWTMAGVD